MNKNLSPGAIILILTVFFIIIGVLYWQGASPARRSEQIEKSIEATVIKGPISMPDATTAEKAPVTEPGTGPAQKAKPADKPVK